MRERDFPIPLPIEVSASDFPLETLNNPQAVLAMIINVEGPSYRPQGAAMVVLPDGSTVGNISSGCIEHDVIRHATAVREGASPMVLRYGKGSPFLDLELPCGGGLDILITRCPERNVLCKAQAQLERREPVDLSIDVKTGMISHGDKEAELCLRVIPKLRIIALGTGYEVIAFASLAHMLGYETLLVSPDEATISSAVAQTTGLPAEKLRTRQWPTAIPIDDRTAVALFFHDHSWEPDILKTILLSNAFYIGAQGSARAQDARHTELRRLRIPDEVIARMQFPFGMITSARDPRTLAVSVLADILRKTRIK